jgi:signal transduction histidine kinase/ligand-binding sensor domain-containing protein
MGYYTRTWTTDDGVPHNSVMRAVQDKAGFLWFGTSAGLARFDGQKFIQVDLGAGLWRSAAIRELVEESPGVLLALTSGSRLLRISSEGVSEHPCTQHVSQLGQELFDLYVEPTGAVWLATGAGSLMRCAPDGRVELFGVDEPVAARTKRFTFATDGSGTTWIASDDFLASHVHGKLDRHPQTPSGPLMITASQSGAIWIGAKESLLKLSKGEVSLVSDAVPWKGDFSSLRHLIETRQGEVVFTGRGQIIRYRDGRFSTFPTPFAIANYLLEDREQNLWVGTNGGGVAQVRERTHRIFNESSGLRPDNVSALAEDAGKNIWIANRSGGLHRLNTYSGHVERWPAALDKVPVETVAVTGQGAVWFGGRDTGLWRLPTPASPAEQLEIPAGGVNALLATRSGHVWFATTNGDVGRFLHDRLDPLGGQDSHALESIYAMVEDADGAIWFGGRRGMLARWDGTAFTRQDHGMIPGIIHSLLIDRDGKLWVGTSAGLALYENGAFHWLTTDRGVPDDIIYNIVEDDHGHLWLATRRGLFYVLRDELLVAAHDKSRRVAASRYGPEQGLRGFSPTPNFSPGVIKSSVGHLWFSSTQGVVEVDTSQTSRAAHPLPVHLDVVRWGGEVSSRRDQIIEFPAGRHRVDFELVVLSYADPENVVIEHRLKGFDRDWVDTGIDRTATYTNLPPGAYQLHARVRTIAGNWSEKEKLISLVIVPAWWDRLSTQIVAAAALLGLVASVVRVVAQKRLRARLNLLVQQHALEKERSRIARDLHDELGAGLTEVGMLADRLAPGAPPHLAPELSGLAWRTRKLATDLSGIVWTMNAGHTALDHFAGFLRRYAERLFRNTGTRCVTAGVEQIPSVPLPPGVQHQLLATAKEALNNVLRHARASEVRIGLSFVDHVFELQIDDNGIGSVVRSVDEGDGNGLKNMRARIQEIGGTFEFLSTEGRGTRVRFRLQLP